MHEILFRGKDKYTGEMIFGTLDNIDEPYQILFRNPNRNNNVETHTVITETVGQYTGLTDKNGRRIFEGDIVQYNIYDDFDCQSVVKFGEYNQDGSAGEYSARKCIGFYVDVDNFTCPDWCEDAPDYFPKHFKQQNVLEVARDCQVIGNIHDNPDILNNN